MLAAHDEMDWSEKLLYLGIFLGVLILGAILLYLLCHFTNKEEDNDVEANKARTTKQATQKPMPADNQLATGKQTMVSNLRRSAADNDVILATAMSSIPLKLLGGAHNDIIINVSQQMLMDKDLESREEHQCVVCSNRQEVTWGDLKCYAQTTIGVLVYKRALIEPPEEKLKY